MIFFSTTITTPTAVSPFLDFSNPALWTPIAIGGFALLALALLFYGWLGSRVLKKATLPQQPFTLVDVGVASLLAAWLIWVISTSFGKDEEINLTLIALNSLLYFCLVGGIAGLLYFRNLKPVTLFGLHPPHFGTTIKLAFLYLLAVYPLLILSQSAIQPFVPNENDVQTLVLYFLKNPGWKERCSIIAMATLVAPIAEEFIFRGYLYGVARRFLGRIPGIAISSVLFAAMHLHLPSMPGLTVLAVMLCLLYERTGSLWSNIIVHATFNTISIVMLLIFKDAVL
ncbi:MAG: CPBP family intramembrane metalloprotease [Verrucomicrobia bacterium]|nr:CPBP family intramembrane metalloprotease [Verrucomicrobiota bacterium]